MTLFVVSRGLGGGDCRNWVNPVVISRIRLQIIECGLSPISKFGIVGSPVGSSHFQADNRSGHHCVWIGQISHQIEIPMTITFLLIVLAIFRVVGDSGLKIKLFFRSQPDQMWVPDINLVEYRIDSSQKL